MYAGIVCEYISESCLCELSGRLRLGLPPPPAPTPSHPPTHPQEAKVNIAVLRALSGQTWALYLQQYRSHSEGFQKIGLPQPTSDRIIASVTSR